MADDSPRSAGSQSSIAVAGGEGLRLRGRLRYTGFLTRAAGGPHMTAPRTPTGRFLGHARLPETDDCWSALAHGATDLVQAPEWVAVMARRAGQLFPGQDLQCFVARRGDHPVATALLCRDTVKPPRGPSLRRLRTLTLNGSVMSDGLLAEDARPEEVATLLRGTRFEDGSTWDLLEASRVRPPSALYRLCSLLPGARCEPDGSVAVIDVPRSFADWETSLDRARRKDLRNARHRLEAGGVTRTVRITAPRAVEAGFEDFVRLEDSGWKKGRGSLAGEPESKSMVRDLLVGFARNGRAGIDQLFVGERLIGSQLWFRVGETLFGMKTAYAEDFAHLSPGKLLLADLIRNCCEEGLVSRIDCMADSEWLKSWGARHEVTYAVSGFNVRSLRGALGAARRIARGWAGL